MTNVIPTKGTQVSHQEAQLEWWKSSIGPYALPSVTPRLLAEYRDELLSGSAHRGDRHSPATVNRYIAALFSAYTYAIRELATLRRKVRRYRLACSSAAWQRALPEKVTRRLRLELRRSERNERGLGVSGHQHGSLASTAQHHLPP
jgi:hypothetical protein